MKTMEAFYHECIDSKIVQCERRAMRLNGKSPCTHIQADLKRAQLIFFEDQKERLVSEMLTEDFGRDLNKISEFLNKAFLSQFGRSVHVADKGASNPTCGEVLSGNHECCPRNKTFLENTSQPVEPSCSDKWELARIERLFELPWSDGSLLAEEE